MGAGGACGATPSPPHRTLGPTSRDVAWRDGLREEGTGQHAGERTRGGAGGGGRGAGGQAGGGEPASSHPTPTLCHAAPPPLSRASPRPQRHRGAAAPPDAFVLLPLSPAPFPSRAAHGWRRGSRAGRGGARPPRAALGTDRVNDPSAGSPTETLLRLLLPLDSQVRPSSQRSARAVGRPRRGRSEGLTKPSNR